MPEGFSDAMEKLGKAVKAADETMPSPTTFCIETACSVKGSSFAGDKQLMTLWLGYKKGGDEPYLCVQLRTLTKTPSQYGHDRILRRMGETYYIENGFVMRHRCWMALLSCMECMKGEINAAALKYYNKK